MVSMCVSCRCCMFVSCVHHVAVLIQCCILHDLQFVNAGRGCKTIWKRHTPEPVS